jgi:hypothetical protein
MPEWHGAQTPSLMPKPSSGWMAPRQTLQLRPDRGPFRGRMGSHIDPIIMLTIFPPSLCPTLS